MAAETMRFLETMQQYFVFQVEVGGKVEQYYLRAILNFAKGRLLIAVYLNM